jgi:5-formyltetrahydrofolate cyclo-ligase
LRVDLPDVAKYDSINLEGVTNNGELRERIWSALVKQNAAAYPLPPHGHNPNFKGSSTAAKKLILHPLWTTSSVILTGMEAALGGLRALALEQKKILIVPHRTKAGSYWRLENAPKAAAKLPNMPIYGMAITSLEGVQLAVLASVIVDKTGQRLSKGFGFGAHGPPVQVPVLTIAHQLMLLEKLPFEADSTVAGFATPNQLFTT